MLKRYLQVSVGDLHVVYKKISLVLENQHKEIKTMIAQETIQILQAQNKPFYAQVVIKVSVFTLKKVYKQFLMVSNVTENLLQPCSSTFKSSMGLPCSHKIQELLEDNQCLQLDDFHQHCSVLDNMISIFQESTMAIQDPQVLPTRECPVGAKNHTQPSTKKDLSTFELIMSGKYRKCGICHETGHNSRMCPNAESDESS
ncbi:21835_t:CDS:2 [Gigaspora margarita]|uniref:21835_t:CDS:1 n=1 Tax=Gigaspora margarita TaxID=4874 RepID=A0ABM8W3C7_GIGMA|nr:21835_t:CDS:2 [Gigaspora margarita]